MTVSWNEDYDPHELAKRLEQSKANKKGSIVKFDAYQYTEYVAVLRSMLTYKITIPEREKSIILRDALHKSGEKGRITSNIILAEINKRTNQFLNLPKIKYATVSSLSIKQKEKLLPRFRIHGNTITAQPRLNRKHYSGIEHIRKLVKINNPTKLPDNYLPIKVSISARTINEAFDIAIDSLDLIRGIWNLAYNLQKQIQIPSGKGNPINNILLGPFHSLHFANGTLATDSGWFDPNFQIIKPLDITKSFRRLINFYKNVMGNLRKSYYQKELENAIILYVRALDHPDWGSAFLKLWSVLEKLTNAQGSVLIRRASFVFEDREYFRQVLKHLKDYRNNYVHNAFDSYAIGVHLYQLKECVETLLGFHIANNFRFKSIGAATEFLDLPNNEKTLKYQIRLREYAQKYLKPSK